MTRSGDSGEVVLTWASALADAAAAARMTGRHQLHAERTDLVDEFADHFRAHRSLATEPLAHV